MRLPVITGFGGINPAGRVSFHHAYKRLVIDALVQDEQSRTYQSLAGLMGLSNPGEPETRAYIDDHTLIRRIELFDPENIYVQRAAKLGTAQSGEPLSFILHKRQLPHSIPSGWQLDPIDDLKVRVSICGEFDALLPDIRSSSTELLMPEIPSTVITIRRIRANIRVAPD